MAALTILRSVSILTVALAGSFVYSQTPTARPVDVARMDQIVQSYVTQGAFMGSVLVARGNEILFNKSYGSANLEWNISNAANTRFRIGSMTKQFTAASILLLEERGKLNVEDLVSKYLPETPAAWEKMTIHHVLTHTAGIPDYTAQSNFTSEISWHALTPQQLVALFKDKPLNFAVGEGFRYSNSGYALLGYLIENITGQSYARFVQDNLFAPLRMKDSGYDSSTAINVRRATGYVRQGSEFANAPYTDMTVPYAAGALYSTIEDLRRWEQALFGGKVLRPASLAKMITPFKNGYAYGLSLSTTNGAKAISHSGGISGFNTSMSYYPDSQITVIALSNVQGLAPDRLVPLLSQVAHGKTVQLLSERKEVSVPRTTLARYVGTYELAPGFNMSIALEGDRLLSQMSGQEKLPIFAESETMFFPKAVDAKIEFHLNASGEVASLTLHQDGRDAPAPRISATVQEHKEVPMSAEMLAAYPGNYVGRGGFSITLENGRLMGQIPGQPKFEMFAEAPDKFFLKVVDAQFEFIREEGKVKALLFRQGPANMRAERQ
jgi:CubicO group peptidase (beta-lactamase class C family)